MQLEPVVHSPSTHPKLWDSSCWMTRTLPAKLKNVQTGDKGTVHTLLWTILIRFLQNWELRQNRTHEQLTCALIERFITTQPPVKCQPATLAAHTL